MDRARLARMIDHTLLAPTATDADVVALCAEAVELGVAAVCVSPARLPLPDDVLTVTSSPDSPNDSSNWDDGGSGPIVVCTVVGFPSGAHRSPIKAAEAARAVVDGATEVDMVIDLGAAAARRWDLVTDDIASVRSAVPGACVLKVIIESAALDRAGVVAACEAAERAGADYVKTSTGFHPAGGASTDAVALMAATVGGRLGVKASGGIRDAATALAMVEAGATRLGCSATRAILDGLDSFT